MVLQLWMVPGWGLIHRRSALPVCHVGYRGLRLDLQLISLFCFIFIFRTLFMKHNNVVTLEASFLPRDGRNRFRYSLHLPTEGWPGWVAWINTRIIPYRRPGPPNMEGARRYAGPVCISLTRKRTMFVYYSSFLLIFRLPKNVITYRHSPRNSHSPFSTHWLEFSYMQ